MSRLISMQWTLVALIAGVTSQAASAADVDPCTTYKWDVSRELNIMKQTPQAIGAASKPGANVPQVKVGALYSLTLVGEAGVTFAASPARSRRIDDATAGLVRFRTAKGGHYRVSITSGHWIDIVERNALLKSLDFQGHIGCERPRKIVEYALPADSELTLQLSGSKDAEVMLAITAVGGAAAD